VVGILGDPTMVAKKLTVLLMGAAISCACSGTGDPGSGDCKGAKCDDGDNFQSELEGRNDPIAKFLRTLTPDADGLVALDYDDVVAGIAKIQGCAPATSRAFIVSDPLVEGEPFPRVITTVCADSSVKASEAFIAASFKHPKDDDIDDLRLEMFAWDEQARQYRFYATERAGGDKVEVEVEPARCRECHLTPTDLPTARSLATDSSEITTGQMRMTPIMNELTRPWSHWSSQVPMFNDGDMPFPSHDFDVPASVRDAARFVRLARERAAEAQRFEDIIREGHARVTGARVRERRDIPGDDWRPAMYLLRPLFCEEQVQYATEDFQSGLLLVTSVIPGGMREAFNQLRPSVEPVVWPWGWLANQDGRMRLAAPATVGPLFMIPVRGNADIDYENRLIGAGAVSPMDVIRVRALDWKRPVFSDFRCNLWKSALARFEVTPPAIDPSTRNSTRMARLFPEIMTLDGVALSPVGADQVIALDVASDTTTAALADALRAGTLADATCDDGAGFCSVDVTTLGGMLDVHVTGFEERAADDARAELVAARDARLCRVLRFFPNAPALPEIECKDEPEPGAASFAGQNAQVRSIPDDDPKGASSDISAASARGLKVDTVQVSVDIDHTFRGDLKLTLTAPGGTTADVVSFDPDDSQDDVVDRFDVPGIATGSAGDGTWTLKVVDRAGADIGKLRRWSIGINTPAP
jgi:hypothetical protein